MGIEGRDGHAGQSPDVVEVDLAGQHIHERFVGLGLLDRYQHLDFGNLRLAEAWLTGFGVAWHTLAELPARQRRDAGKQRRTARQQAALGDQRIDARFVAGNEIDTAPADWQCRAGLFHEHRDAGLAAFGVNHGLRKQRRLSPQASLETVLPAGADGLDGAVTRAATPHGLELALDHLEVRVGQRVVERQRRGRAPINQAALPLSERAPEHRIAVAQSPVAYGLVRCRQHILTRLGDGIDGTKGQGLRRRKAAPAEHHLQRIDKARSAAACAQQPRQALRAAVARQQPQPNFRLPETCRRLGNTQMAGQRKLHAAAQRHALDCRDAGLAHRLDLSKSQMRGVRQRPRLLGRVHFFEQLPDVGTGDKACGAFAGEHHGSHIVAPRKVFDNDGQLIQGAFVQGVDRGVGDKHRRHLARCIDRVVLNLEVAIALEQLLLVRQRLPTLPGLDHPLELIQAFRVLQRRCVAHRLSLDQRTHHAAHVLATARFRELADLDEVARHRHGTLLLAHQFGQFAAVFRRQLAASTRLDEGQRREAFLAVRCADDDDVADRRVRVERA